MKMPFLRSPRMMTLLALWLLVPVAWASDPAQISYVPPLLGSADVVVGGGSRGAQYGEQALCALAPMQVGVTHRASPTLYWFSSLALEQGPELQLVDLATNQVLLEHQLAASDAGIQRLVLRDFGVMLVQGRNYRWSLSLPVENTNLEVSGYIRFEPAAPMLLAPREGVSATELPVTLAAAGNWYDSIWLLSELIRANPQQSQFREQRLALLESVPLPIVAAFDRQTLTP